VTVSEAALAGPAMPPAPRPSELLLHGLLEVVEPEWRE